MQDFYRMTRAESRFDTKREKTENWDDHETQRTILALAYLLFSCGLNGIKSCLCSSTIKNGPI